MDLAHLHELFPRDGFRFSMKMRPGNLTLFFAPTSEGPELLAERRRWIAEHPRRHVLSDGQPVESLADLPLPEQGARIGSGGSPMDRVRELGGVLEPDFLLLEPDAGGQFVLRAGCVCFPSSWAPEEKLGRPLGEIHGVVPGLNAAIGQRIQQFLARLKPGVSWLRSNWGISASDERNQHPGRGLPALLAGTPPESVWLRIEHQLLHGLTGGFVLFGIRLEVVSLACVREDRVLREGLLRSLRTLPVELAVYKNLHRIGTALIHYLDRE